MGLYWKCLGVLDWDFFEILTHNVSSNESTAITFALSIWKERYAKKKLNRCRSPKLGICHLLCPTKPFKPFGQKAEKRDKVFTFLLGPPDDHLFAASYWSTSWSSSLSCKLLRCQKGFVHYSLTFIKQLSICHCLVKQILNPINNWFSRAKIKLKTFFEI